MSSKKGITLITLILTIVLLLILSGIRMVTEIKDKGIISKAEQARMQAEQQEIEEKYERLKVFDNSNLIDVEKTIKKLQENFENIKITEPQIDTSYTISIKGNYGTYTYDLDDNGLVELNILPISIGKAYALILDAGNDMYDMVFTRSDDYEIKDGQLYSNRRTNNKI